MYTIALLRKDYHEIHRCRNVYVFSGQNSIPYTQCVFLSFSHDGLMEGVRKTKRVYFPKPFSTIRSQSLILASYVAGRPAKPSRLGMLFWQQYEKTKINWKAHHRLVDSQVSWQKEILCDHGIWYIYICVSINHLCVVWSHKYGSASLCSVCIYKGGMQHFTKSCKSLLSMVDIWATTASTTHNNMIWELPPLVIIVCCWGYTWSISFYIIL